MPPSLPTPHAPSGLDFSSVDSPEKANVLYQNGELAQIRLPPLEGHDNPLNQVVVPHFVIALKDQWDNMVAELANDGKVSSFNVSPEYKGASWIPCALLLEAKGDAEGGYTTKERIDIW
jgi:hypothetical protein